MIRALDSSSESKVRSYRQESGLQHFGRTCMSGTGVVRVTSIALGRKVDLNDQYVRQADPCPGADSSLHFLGYL